MMALRNTVLFAESWNVAFRRTMCGAILQDTTTEFTVIKNSFRYWAADPFVVEYEQKTYIFAELYDYILRRGVLGYCEIKGNKATKWKPIVVAPYHLSYPCVVLRDGKYWMMPESGGGNNLTVYEVEQFPNVWKKPKVIRDNVKFADTTPLMDSFSWALTHQVEDAQTPQLLLIDLNNEHADKLIVDAIPLNSRPAGNVFVYNEWSVRPAQLSTDCGDGYGKALIFYRYKLNENMEYTESKIKVIEPQELKYDRNVFLDGMHTYNASQHYEVIDIKTRRFNLLDFVMRVVGKFIK